MTISPSFPKSTIQNSKSIEKGRYSGAIGWIKEKKDKAVFERGGVTNIEVKDGFLMGRKDGKTVRGWLNKGDDKYTLQYINKEGADSDTPKPPTAKKETTVKKGILD